jgi:hypothetical protein
VLLLLLLLLLQVRGLLRVVWRRVVFCPVLQ